MQTWGFGQREEGLKYMGKYQTKILERDATMIPFPGVTRKWNRCVGKTSTVGIALAYLGDDKTH
jgi:hypothetical protein